MPKRTLLALGDCNTLGVGALEHDTFVERFARHVGLEPVNLGYTMSTTREALRMFDERFGDDVAVLLIQYGLVDSWLTFKYSPYVLYYPDNPLRKYLRKAVKSLKKTARRVGLNRLIGERPVVPIPRYRRQLDTYRTAAAELLRLDATHIECVVLFVAADTAVQL